MTVDNAKADQISFIINLMHGYNERDFDFKKTQMDLNKDTSYSSSLAIANVFLNIEKKSKKRNKKFLSKEI